MIETQSPSGKPKPKPPLPVALSDELGNDEVPKVIAKGRGAIAEQILKIAFAHGVRVREDAGLAEILSVIDIDSEIPIEAFAAVAEILTYIYLANGRLAEFQGQAGESVGEEAEEEDEITAPSSNHDSDPL